MVLTCLPVFGEVNTIKLPKDSMEITLDEADKKKLKALNKALSESKSSNKSMYASWARHFIVGMGVGSDINFEAILAYWLSWYVLLAALR